MERMILIALIGSVTAIQMRAVRREYALLIGAATGIVLLVSGIARFTGLSDWFRRTCETYGVPTELFASILKILGIAYLSEFGVNLAKDAGQQTIAWDLELGGRIMILSSALPAVVTLLETGAALIREVGS
ncbi:MAG: hypothetical protein II872_03170 [Clostridia bacterium]|jgi:stage III sporulation protein AD|nr:hypothetical protein [Clostridia bacterium]